MNWVLKKKKEKDRTSEANKEKKEKKKRTNSQRRPRKKKKKSQRQPKKKKKVKRWSKVAAVSPLCVFNYNIAIEL